MNIWDLGKEGKLWEVVGIREKPYKKWFSSEVSFNLTEQTVALFTDFNKAQEYINNSKLKHPLKGTHGGDVVYRRKSLLSDFQDAYIQRYDPKVHYTIDPEIGVK